VGVRVQSSLGAQRGVLTDLSRDGGFVGVRKQPAIGETVRVELSAEIAGGSPVALYGAVVRVNPVGGGQLPGIGLWWRAARAANGATALELAGFVADFLDLDDATVQWHDQMKAHVCMFGGELAPRDSGAFAPMNVEAARRAAAPAITPAAPEQAEDEDVLDAFRPAPTPPAPAQTHQLAAHEPGIADDPERSRPGFSLDQPEETSGIGRIGRKLLTVTGKLLGRGKPAAVTGKDLVSPDGWFYHPEGDGPLHVAEDGVALRTGNARRSAPQVRKPRRPGRHAESGGAKVASLDSARVKPGKVPTGNPGELFDVDVPCSFLLHRTLSPGRLLRAGNKAIVIAIEGRDIPESDARIEVNVPVYLEGTYHTLSLEGVVRADPVRVGERLCFMLWITRVNEWSERGCWKSFLVDEKIDQPHPANEDTGPVRPPPRRKASA